MLELSHQTKQLIGEINISGSKSESNRWLILKQLFPEIPEIQNLGNAKDTQVLKRILSNDQLSAVNTQLNVGHAGTAMRFLTAYFATKNGVDVILTGSERMQQRPISPLVDALRSLGCDIQYQKQEGYPPLIIKGKHIEKDEISIQANVSSQYITALMLIAPKLPKGLIIHFSTKLTSRPYVEMTKAQLESIGIKVEWLKNGIKVYPNKKVSQSKVMVESDWSSVSYWYSMLALSKGGNLKLSSFKKHSLQGDSALVEIYKNHFGVETVFKENQLILSKSINYIQPNIIELDLNKTPDIAQTIAVTCSGLKIKAKLTGLHTLKVKETDRLVALQNELKKVGTQTKITEDSLEIISFSDMTETPQFKTYDDHRMAMSFAPLALQYPIKIEDENVVVKSYPNFWQDLEKVGFQIDSV